jgi:hypothetical protein
MFSLLSAQFASGSMGITIFTTAKQEGTWQEAQSESFEKGEFGSKYPHCSTICRIKAAKAAKKVTAADCANATSSHMASRCREHQAISHIGIGGNRYT